MAAAKSGEGDLLSGQLQTLQIVEKPTESIPVPVVGAPMETSTNEPEAAPSTADNAMDTSGDNLPTVLIMMGMAGSGKTTLTSMLINYLYGKGSPPYVVNLDPACNDPPYGVNIDIRDTINYKEVMRGNRLGPNGAIVTSLNLFSTKFDMVLDLLKSRGKRCKYILIDTPGQIEVFMWSASGSIITELLASNFPTVMIYVTDLLATRSPVAFMSNMTYACSVLYKTKLPLVLALNKCDVQAADKVKTWITDFTEFQKDLRDVKGQTANLASSLSLVLDDFYSSIQHVEVSALTGTGLENLFKAIGEAVNEYKTIYRVNYDKMVLEEKKKLAMPKTKPEMASDSVAFSVPGTSATGMGLTLSLGDESEPESEEEDPHLREEEDENLDDVGTIAEVYKKEAARRKQKQSEEEDKMS